MRKESVATVNNGNISSVTRNESTVGTNNAARADTSNVIGFVNGRKTGLSNPKDITADPVTHDELAMYFKYGMDMLENKFAALQKKNEENINILNDAVAKITKSFGLLNEGIASLHSDSNKASDVNSDLLKTICEAIVENNKNNSITLMFMNNKLNGLNDTVQSLNSSIGNINSASSSQRYSESLNGWVSLAWEALGIIGERSGQAKKTVLREVYALMRSNGIKLDSLFVDYKIRHPLNPKYIDMISENENLRNEFQNCVDILHRKYFPEEYVETKPKRRTSCNYVFNITPPEILAGMEKYKKRHSIRTNRGCAHSIAKQMNKVGNINMAALRREKATELHYSNVCFGYLVNSSEDLKRIFDDVVENW